MSPSNKKKHSKAKAASSMAPHTPASTLESREMLAAPSAPPVDTSTASETGIAFCQFIERADLQSIKCFLDAAASLPSGKNLRFIWARAFKEGLTEGHKLYGKTEEKLKLTHDLGYEEGFKDSEVAGYDQGVSDGHTDMVLEGHGPQCFGIIDQYDDYGNKFKLPSMSTSTKEIPLHEDLSTQTKPPSMVTTGTCTSDENHVMKTQPSPPRTSSSTQTDSPSEPKPPMPPPSSSACLNWADDAASLPIYPTILPPRDLSVLCSSSPKPFASLQRRNK